MQHGLLALALALIAAIVAALGAPLFVDWNAWRPEFERRASLVVGAPVSIKGPIEATILPTPAFTLHDVTVGDAGQGTGLSAGKIRGILSLGALFRGAVEAEEVALTKPKMWLSLGPDGRLRPGGMGSTSPFSISRFSVEGGTLTIDDRANGKRFQFNDVAATGEMQSRTGPFRLDASFNEDGKPRNNSWKLRASTGDLGDGDGKMRLSLGRADGTQLDADGTLALKNALPRFEGKLTLSQPGALPWKLVANAAASDLSMALDDLTLSFGAADAAVELSGQARIEPWKRGLIEAELSGKFVDLDRAEGAQKQDITAALKPLRDALAGFKDGPLSAKVKLSIAQLVAGGGNLRDVSGTFALKDGVPMPERLEARLPGRGTLSMTGAALPAGNFKGRFNIAAEEPAALVEWTGMLSPDAMGTGVLKLDGNFVLSGTRLTLDPFTLSLGDTKLSGDLVYNPPGAAARGRIDARLAGNGADLALLAPLARKGLGRESPLDVKLSLDVQGARILDQSARRFSVILSRKEGGLSLDNLVIENMSGLSLTARGELASYAERPKGRIEFTASASDPTGVNRLVAGYTTPDAAAYLRRILTMSMPLDLKGSIEGRGENPIVTIDAKGKAGATTLSLVGSGDPQSLSVEDLRLALDAPDASSLVALLGLPQPEPQAGQGRLEIALGKREKDAAPLRASLVFPGIDLSAEGMLQYANTGINPRVNVKLEATDFRALSIAAARASNDIVPLSGTARLARADGGFALEDLSLSSGDTRVTGRIALKNIEAPALSGELSVNRSDLATLLSIALGRTGEGSPWSDKALGPSPLEGMTGDFVFESAAFGLGGKLAATGVRGKLRVSGKQVFIEDFSGDLAGGKFTARARISRPDLISFDGGFTLTGADIARLVSPADWRSPIRGKGNFTLDLAGQGASPAQLATSIAGRGKYSIESLEIDRLAPGALAKVVAATAKESSPDESAVRAQLAKAIEQAPLKIQKIEGPLVAAGGIVRASKVALKAEGADLVPDVALDLAKLNLDASFAIENPAPKGVNARPGVTVAWRGPWLAPARSLEISPLMTMISLRAMDGVMPKVTPDRASAVAAPAIPPLATETVPPPPSPAPPKPKAQPKPKRVAPAPSWFGSRPLDPIH